MPLGPSREGQYNHRSAPAQTPFPHVRALCGARLYFTSKQTPGKPSPETHWEAASTTVPAAPMTAETGGTTVPAPQGAGESARCREALSGRKGANRPNTPWSGARQTAAAQPGTARDTTRPTRRPPAPLGSQAGSHHHPTQGDREPTEALDTSAVTGHSAARLWAEVAGYIEEHVCHRRSHLNYAALT
jgi:hypothetical protein